MLKTVFIAVIAQTSLIQSHLYGTVQNVLAAITNAKVLQQLAVRITLARNIATQHRAGHTQIKKDKLLVADTAVQLMKTKKRLRKLDETRGDLHAEHLNAVAEFHRVVQNNMPLEECDKALKRAMTTEKQLKEFPELEKKLLEEKYKWKQEQEEICKKFLTESQE